MRFGIAAGGAVEAADSAGGGQVPRWSIETPATVAMPATTTTLTASDLYALLDRDFRRRTRQCTKCNFSMPYRLFGNGRDPGNWSVIPSASCSHYCEAVLDEVVSGYRSTYRLSETGRFHAVAR